MRLIYLAFIVLVVATVLVFVFQNLHTATVSFIGVTIHTHIAVLVFEFCAVGAVTALFALLRRSCQRSRVGSVFSS